VLQCAIKRLKRELREYNEKEEYHPFIVFTQIDPHNFQNLEAKLSGFEGTPYEGGVFELIIESPIDYSFKQPKISIETPICHR
jgi:ubiquitin-protein ligase